jgi:ABC-type polar amino acid transport system, ATPase component
MTTAQPVAPTPAAPTPGAPTPAVEIRNAQKSYGTNKVLAGIDWTLQAGHVVAIIGPSGSGKSTLLRAINHLDKLDLGYVSVFGDLVGVQAQRAG